MNIKQLLRLGKLIPILTITGGIAAILLSFFQVIPLTTPENIIVGLLLLLAIDAFAERLDILDKIEAKLDKITSGNSLRSRNEIIPVEEQAKYASEICILAPSAISLSVRFISFFENKIKNGCKLRIILLDPDSPAVEIFKWQSKTQTIDSDVTTSLSAFNQLVNLKKVRGKCEIRLSKAFTPFSMFAVDMKTDKGTMIVEFRGYKKALNEFPHVYLTRGIDSHWFTFYERQFEQIWAESKVWIP